MKDYAGNGGGDDDGNDDGGGAGHGAKGEVRV